MICYRKLAVIFATAAAVTQEISIRRSTTLVAVNRYANYALIGFPNATAAYTTARITSNMQNADPCTLYNNAG